MANHHLIRAQKLLRPPKPVGEEPPEFIPPADTVALAQVEALLQIAGHMGDISAELQMIREALSTRDF